MRFFCESLFFYDIIYLIGLSLGLLTYTTSSCYLLSIHRDIKILGTQQYLWCVLVRITPLNSWKDGIIVIEHQTMLLCTVQCFIKSLPKHLSEFHLKENLLSLSSFKEIHETSRKADKIEGKQYKKFEIPRRRLNEIVFYSKKIERVLKKW